MSELHDPTRLRDLAGELPAELIAGLRAYPQAGPSAGERTQMRAALMAAVSVPAPTAPATIETPMTAKQWSLLTLAKRIGVAVGLCSAVFVGSRMLAPETTPAPAVTTPPAVVAAPAAEPPSVAPEVTAAAPAAPEPAAAAPEPRRAMTRKAHRPVARAVAADPAAELLLLKRARRALASSPTQALALTDEHLSAHPHGVFEQERELIAIEALVRGGEARDAARRAAAFRARFPGSAHLERLRVLLQP